MPVARGKECGYGADDPSSCLDVSGYFQPAALGQDECNDCGDQYRNDIDTPEDAMELEILSAYPRGEL